jgi:gamma-glutamylcyclotransferase (GGCT)/AIG2-like uncharacterized protein YtfP
MSCDLLFVYGTLRRGSGTEMHRRLAAEAEFVSPATFRGRLFLVGDYPGAALSDTATDIVHGDLYHLDQPETSLDWIDQYERCGDRFPAPQEYIRRIAPVCLPDGSVRQAWLYLYNHPVEGFTRLSSGDFLHRP